MLRTMQNFRRVLGDGKAGFVFDVVCALIGWAIVINVMVWIVLTANQFLSTQ